MNYYFRLQYRLLLRQIAAFGFYPWLGILLAMLGFFVFTFLLFYKIDFAEYIYAAIALFYVGNLSGQKRNELLQLNFSEANYRNIRLIENGLVTVPFLVGLFWNKAFLVTVLLLGFSFALAFYQQKNRFNWAFPTPFYRHPFEYLVGFRRFFWIVVLAYVILIIGIIVDNYNLGMFCIFVLILLSMGFHFAPEGQYHVWIFKHSPKAFLGYKLKIGLLYLILFCLPAVLILGIYEPSKFYFPFILISLGLIYLSAFILAKYASFPNEMGLIPTFLFVFGIWMPPLILVSIPIFYRQALKKLNPILA